MKRVLVPAALLLGNLMSVPHAQAAEQQAFWNLNPEQLRLLVAAPQVMVTRTASGLDAYCRCPVVLKPHEIPEVMKSKGLVADTHFGHGGAIGRFNRPFKSAAEMDEAIVARWNAAVGREDPVWPWAISPIAVAGSA